MPQDQIPQFGQTDRSCPWCGSRDVRLFTRGYAGPTDETDQYLVCANCRRITYELVSKNAREMRLGRWRPGGIYREPATKTKYRISRILKVGLNEFLIYLKPLVNDPENATENSPQSR